MGILLGFSKGGIQDFDSTAAHVSAAGVHSIWPHASLKIEN
jgi:hypothetical protein